MIHDRFSASGPAVTVQLMCHVVMVGKRTYQMDKDMMSLNGSDDSNMRRARMNNEYQYVKNGEYTRRSIGSGTEE